MSDCIRISRSVVLAAGRGTRMGGLTDDLPKPMIPVRGRPVLESIVRGLVANGVTEILLIVGYRKEVIEEFFGDGADFGCRISYVEQVVQDGTGRVVELAAPFTGDKPFLLSYGDILVPEDSYRELLEMGGRDGSLSIKVNQDVSQGGAVFISDDGWVTGLIEKPGPGQPTSPYYNAGIYAFSPAVYEYTARLELSPRGEYELTDAIQAMVKDGLRIKAVELPGEWADVRDPEVLEALNRSEDGASQA